MIGGDRLRQAGGAFPGRLRANSWSAHALPEATLRVLVVSAMATAKRLSCILYDRRPAFGKSQVKLKFNPAFHYRDDDDDDDDDDAPKKKKNLSKNLA